MAASKTPVDPLDRALAFREEGLDRKSLSLLGFLPENRGGLGINGAHVHEVAWSISRGVKLVRYKQVDVIRVPAAHMETWRAANKEKCAAQDLLPRFSPHMKFACLTKTHFTHGNKLVTDGSRTFMNDGATPLVYLEESAESKKIEEDGVQCSVYREELWDDKEALMALMNADNDDADIEMGEDEIQAQGRIETAINAIVAQEKVVDIQSVFADMKRAGLRAYSDGDTKAMIELRLAWTPAVAQCFRSCVFNTINGRVNVQASLPTRIIWLIV